MSGDLASLLRACRSPNDLDALGRIETPLPVRTALAAVYASEPPKGSLALWPKLSTHQWPLQRPRRAIFKVGRRGLKTTAMIRCAVFELLCGEHEAHVAPGTRIYSVIVAPTLAQAREAVLNATSYLDSLSVLGVRFEATRLGSAPELRITSPVTTVEPVLTVLVGDATSVRGRALVFVGLDEAGYLPAESHLAQSGKDIFIALTAGQVQFARPLTVLASTPGPPAGVFYEMATTPPPGTLVIDCPSWVMNPRISRDRALAEAGGDEQVFRQEHEASAWGYSGETFIDGVDVRACLSSCEPREVFGVNDGDESSLITIEHISLLQGSRNAPVEVSTVVELVARLSRQHGNAGVIFDSHYASEIRRGLEARGVDCKLARMDAPSQTRRWATVKALFRSRRVVLSPGVYSESNRELETLAQQLSQLRVEQLSSGSLRVEGRRDDLADAFALAAEHALASGEIAIGLDFAAVRDATGIVVVSLGFGPGVVVEEEPVRFQYGVGISGGGRSWWKVSPGGARTPMEPPLNTPEWHEHVERMSASGATTPKIERWRASLNKEAS